MLDNAVIHASIWTQNFTTQRR